MYDFGDEWNIELTFEKIDPKLNIEHPVVFDVKGFLPDQYPFDDDEF